MYLECDVVAFFLKYKSFNAQNIIIENKSYINFFNFLIWIPHKKNYHIHLYHYVIKHILQETRRNGMYFREINILSMLYNLHCQMS